MITVMADDDNGDDDGPRNLDEAKDRQLEEYSFMSFLVDSKPGLEKWEMIRKAVRAVCTQPRKQSLETALAPWISCWNRSALIAGEQNEEEKRRDLFEQEQQLMISLVILSSISCRLYLQHRRWGPNKETLCVTTLRRE
jgi:hypothetical protein